MEAIITEPLVSIIVRTCNRQYLLKRALKSILNQNYPAIEIIVVDDGAYPVNRAFLDSVGKTCKTRYIQTGQKGRSFAANKGIDAAGGDFVIFLDDDDELYPEHVRVLIHAVLKKQTIVYSDCELSFEKYDPGTDCLSVDEQFVRFSTDFSQGLLFVRNYIPLMCLCFSVNFLKKTGGFNEDIDLFEDWDLLLRLSLKTDFYHIPEVTAKYRFWGKSQITSQNESDTRDDYVKIVSNYIEHITPKHLHEIFLYSEDKYNTISELAKCQKKLSEKEASCAALEASNLTRCRKKLSEKEASCAALEASNKTLNDRIPVLEYELKIKSGKLLDTENRLIQTENLCDRLKEDNKTLLTEKAELYSIHQMYVAENLRKEEYIELLDNQNRTQLEK